MKISKRTRELAALICQIAASNTRRTYSEIADDLGIIWDRSTLIPLCLFLSISAEAEVYGSSKHQEADAEAESLLRCGWSPGDLVVRR